MIYDNFAFDCLLSVFNIKNFQQEVLKVGKPLRQSQTQAFFLFFYILTCILNIIKQKQQSSMPKYINFSFLHQCQHLLSGKFQRYCLYLAVSSLSSSISQFRRMTQKSTNYKWNTLNTAVCRRKKMWFYFVCSLDNNRLFHCFHLKLKISVFMTNTYLIRCGNLQPLPVLLWVYNTHLPTGYLHY